jgi:hypothetical protein
MDGDDGDTGRWWAFVDEAIWAPPMGTGCYVLAAAVVEHAALDGLRSAMVGALLPRQRRLHWRDESQPRRRKLAATLAGQRALHVVVVGAPLDRSRQERARRKCLEHLLHLLAVADVERVVLEARTESLNARDTDLVDVLRIRHAIPSHLRVSVQRPDSEPMLWAADIVAGAVRAAIAGVTDEHLDVLSGTVDVHQLQL